MIAKGKIYGNCIMLALDGTMLCRCDEKKINWYLSRGLAELVSDSPKTIKLNFKPKGVPDSSELHALAEKDNLCVVCGSKHDLTRHHAVPYFFRKMFPVKHKNHSSHDVLPLCNSCHALYETESQKFRKVLGQEMGYVPICKPAVKKVCKAKEWAGALRMHRHVMPASRIAELTEKLSKELGCEVTDELIEKTWKESPVSTTDVHRCENENIADFFRAKIQSMTDAELNDFCRRWRQHFVDTMKPKFMYEFWSVDYTSQPHRECHETA